jgi:hypothetical protein
MYLSDSVLRLWWEGYDVRKWYKMPFHEDEGGDWVVEVDMDIGKRRFAIDTGSTTTVLFDATGDKMPWKKEEHGLEYCETKVFRIEGYDFPSQFLFRIQYDDVFHGIDGILGMDFFEEHQVYIDYPEGVLYINPEVMGI